jgi:integrase
MENNMDKTISEAILWARKRLETKPSEKTVQQYIRVVNRLKPKLKQGVLPGSSTNRNTRAIERAAFRHMAAKNIIAQSNNNHENVKKIFLLIKRIDQLADIAQREYILANNTNINKKHPNIQKRKTKRTSLRHLSSDWREKLVEAALDSKYDSQIRVMSICGCRPDEIEKGINVKRLENTVEITIKGSKCSESTNAGQEWRTLIFDANHPLIGDINTGTYQAKAHAIEDAVSHFGKKISKSKKHPISAYSFRHAAASNFKASGLTDKEIAAALGHRSTATMSFYGSKSSSSGILLLKSVSAASPVRTPKTKSKPKLH